MYNKKPATKTTLKVRNVYEGETIEMKMNRIINNKEPITEPGVITTYTDRKDGVKPELNIRTDRWELAIDAMDKVNADKLAKRIERQSKKDQLKADGELKAIQNPEGKSTQDTGKA